MALRSCLIKDRAYNPCEPLPLDVYLRDSGSSTYYTFNSAGILKEVR